MSKQFENIEYLLSKVSTKRGAYKLVRYFERQFKSGAVIDDGEWPQLVSAVSAASKRLDQQQKRKDYELHCTARSGRD